MKKFVLFHTKVDWKLEIRLAKLMVSRDLPRSTVTKQMAFNQPDLHSTPVFERAMDRYC